MPICIEEHIRGLVSDQNHIWKKRTCMCCEVAHFIKHLCAVVTSQSKSKPHIIFPFVCCCLGVGGGFFFCMFVLFSMVFSIRKSMLCSQINTKLYPLFSARLSAFPSFSLDFSGGNHGNYSFIKPVRTYSRMTAV